MTFADLTTIITRKPRMLRKIECTIEIGAFILLNDGRMGELVSIDLVQDEKRGYVIGSGFAASITEIDIFAYRNVELEQAAS
jgi:hypothetical protein